MCERTGGADGRWELCCGLRSGGGASEDGKEEGGGGNCCRGSALAGKAMAGAVKLTELMLSLAETDWFSTGSEDLSFPGGGTALSSILVGWTGGCELDPTGC